MLRFKKAELCWQSVMMNLSGRREGGQSAASCFSPSLSSAPVPPPPRASRSAHGHERGVHVGPPLVGEGGEHVVGQQFLAAEDGADHQHDEKEHDPARMARATSDVRCRVEGLEAVCAGAARRVLARTTAQTRAPTSVSTARVGAPPPSAPCSTLGWQRAMIATAETVAMAAARATRSGPPSCPPPS